MKRLLLDTHALIWWLNGDEQMGRITREEISNPQNDVYVSAATAWEMSIQRQPGKLEAPNDIELKVEQAGFLKLSISLFHGEQAGLLPLHHRDPFDRVIIAQAQAEGLVIVTKDKYFPEYGIRLMNALQ